MCRAANLARRVGSELQRGSFLVPESKRVAVHRLRAWRESLGCPVPDELRVDQRHGRHVNERGIGNEVVAVGIPEALCVDECLNSLRLRGAFRRQVIVKSGNENLRNT